MKSNELDELLQTVESVRATRFAHLPAEFVREVVLVEEANPDSDDRALAEIRKLVEAAVTSEGRD